MSLAAMSENIARNMLSSQGIINYLTQLHLAYMSELAQAVFPAIYSSSTILKMV